ncbi:MAG: hypothetical protein ABIE70_02370 [bacterium]
MAYKDIETEITNLNLDDDEAVQRLVERIRSRTSKEPGELMKLVHSEDKETSNKASLILLSIGAPILPAMVDAIDSASLDNQVWDLESAVEIQMGTRARLVTLLESMLSNKTPLPPPELMGHVEEKPPSLRACDKAYLILRRFLAMRAADAEMAGREIFLDMEESERDQEIDRFTRTGVWIELQESLHDQ